MKHAQAIALGSQAVSQQPSGPYAYQDQWNFAVQRDLGSNTSIQAAYAGAAGVHLPLFWWNADSLPSQYLSEGASLFTQVPNPFIRVIKTGTLVRSDGD